MQQGALNTNRILFIGIGARTPFGTTAHYMTIFR
jgi:hypothetical protein